MGTTIIMNFLCNKNYMDREKTLLHLTQITIRNSVVKEIQATIYLDLNLTNYKKIKQILLTLQKDLLNI